MKLLALFLLALTAACPRKVVVTPEAAQQLNDPDWTVKSEPRK